jgi:hypothetical protein
VKCVKVDVVTATKVNHGFGLECLGIVHYYLVGATKSSKNISFQEIDDHFVSGLPGGHNLNPFGEVVGGSEDTLVLSTRGWIYLSYQV